MLRNASGVIVGVEKRRSGPLIKGFIPLQQPRARQQVIITDANEEPQRGRASQRKQREERIQQQGRKRKARMHLEKAEAHERKARKFKARRKKLRKLRENG